MSQISRNYARALYELHISPDALSRAEEITTQVPVLLDILKDPACALVQKYRAIERIFPEETQNFLKVLCFYQSASLLPEIFSEYRAYRHSQEGVLDAVLTYTARPDEETLAAVKERLKTDFQKKDVNLVLRKNPALLGGFTLEAGGRLLDYSVQGRLRALTQKLTRR